MRHRIYLGPIETHPDEVRIDFGSSGTGLDKTPGLVAWNVLINLDKIGLVGVSSN